MKRTTRSAIKRITLFLLLVVGYVKLQFTALAEEGDCPAACRAFDETCYTNASVDWQDCYDHVYPAFEGCVYAAVMVDLSCVNDCSSKPEDQRDACRQACENTYNVNRAACETAYNLDIADCDNNYTTTLDACEAGYDKCIEKCS